MADDEDFSKLPLASRWRHAKWKARQSAYDEITSSLSRGHAGELPNTDDLRGACSDANVIALESGIKMTTATLASLPDAPTSRAVSIRQAVATPLAEKGLVAAKPAVKQAALEALLTLVAVADPAGVVADILPFLAAKSPKAVTAAAQALDAVFREFGSPVTDPKPVLQALPALFGHTDRNVRVAATNLATSLSRWVGPDTVLAVLSAIKPVQVAELKQSFAKVDRSARPPRLTQSQQRQLDMAEASMADNGPPAGGPEDGQNGAVPREEAPTDPWDFAEPQTVLDKIPDSFWEQANNPKWKERLEGLTTVATMLGKTLRMAPAGDYQRLASELMRIAAKDTNQMCASQAILGLAALANGLRKAYAKYGARTVESVVERFKERKQTVIDTVARCMDEVFFKVMGSQFGPMLEILWPIGVQHKTPGVRLESTKYCAHIVAASALPPSWADIDMMAKGSLKLLGDTQEPMRAAAASLLAACVKIVGEQKLAPVLKSLDDHKRKRVDESMEKITVNSRLQPAAGVSAAAAPPQTQRRPPGASNGPDRSAPGRAPAPTGLRSQAPPHPGQPPAQQPPPGLSQNHARPKPLSTQPPSLAAPRAPRPGQSIPQARPNVPHPASPIGKRGANPSMDSSMSLSSPSHIDSQHRESRPSISSTPKIVKRSFQRAEFTPARDMEAYRRRIYSPAKVEREIEPLSAEIMQSEGDENHLREIARLSAQLNLEKSLRSELEKQLARVQVEKDQDIIRLREEVSTLKVQLQAQKEELRIWIQNERNRNASSGGDDIGTRLSILSIGSDMKSSRPASNGEQDTSPSAGRSGPNVFSSNRTSRVPNRGVMPISLASHAASTVDTKQTKDNNLSPSPSQHRTSSDDWERAVSMTHSLKQRVEQLKQQKERPF